MRVKWPHIEFIVGEPRGACLECIEHNATDALDTKPIALIYVPGKKSLFCRLIDALNATMLRSTAAIVLPAYLRCSFLRLLDSLSLLTVPGTCHISDSCRTLGPA